MNIPLKKLNNKTKTRIGVFLLIWHLLLPARLVPPSHQVPEEEELECLQPSASQTAVGGLRCYIPSPQTQVPASLK